MKAGNPRILIADDHPIALAGIRMALERAGGFTLVGTAADGSAALALVGALRPDILILDLAMPGVSGVEVLDDVRRMAPATHVFVLTGQEEPRLLRHVEAAGAAGMALKSEDPAVWIGLLRRIGRPGRHVSPEVRALLARSQQAAELTPRERQVLLGIARGETNAQLARRMGISMSTVDKHRTALMRKLGAHSIAGLLRAALREGLLHSLGHQ